MRIVVEPPLAWAVHDRHSLGNAGGTNARVAGQAWSGGSPL
jgi:hypothetical protein